MFWRFAGSFMAGNYIPLKTTAAILICSTLCTALLAIGGIFLFKHSQKKHRGQEKFIISAIAQTCSGDERLKTVYLAELLELSVDHPKNFYSFDVSKAEANLKLNPLITTAIIKKIPPKTIYVDYKLRKPIAFLGEYANTAIDSHGYLFPFKPYYTPKSLPEFILGISDGDGCTWGRQLESQRALRALKIYQLAKDLITVSTRLIKIDTSKAYALSYGQRQIVIVFEDRLVKNSSSGPVVCLYPKIVRLSGNHDAQELVNYSALNAHLLSEAAAAPLKTHLKAIRFPATIIDLRVAHLAFVKSSS